MGSLGSIIRFWVFIVFPAVAVSLLFSGSLAAGYYEEKLTKTDTYSTIELNSLIEEHQTKATVLDTQIKEIKKEIDWLILKINRIQDAGQSAPQGLKTSVLTKEQKISTLLKEKARLAMVTAHYIKVIDSRTKKESGVQKPASPKIKVKTIPPEASKCLAGQSGSVRKSDIEEAVKRAGLDDWVEVSGEGTCVRIETTLPLLFSSGSARVSTEYQSFLKKLSSFLKPYDIKIQVKGYTDPVPIRTKQYPSNFELGAARAANIIHELVKQGLKPSIFKIETTGQYRFAAQQPAKQNSFQRRAQVTVIFTG